MPGRRYVADTHALVHHLADSPRLGQAARMAFEEAERGDATIVVPIIALAEIAWLVERGRLALQFDDVLSAIRGHPAYFINPLDKSRLECFIKTTGVPEMHDRFIVSEAILCDAALITADHEIKASGMVPVIW